MQQSQRTRFNHALEFAIAEANRRDLPLVVGFGLAPSYPEANERHHAFMLQGLAEVASELQKRGIAFIARRGTPPEVTIDLAQRGATLVVCDRGYLKHQIAWRAQVAEEAGCRVVQVESDAVVPVDEVSTKHEVGARTLRPKLHRLWRQYLVPLRQSRPKMNAATLRLSPHREFIDLADLPGTLRGLDLDPSVKPVRRFAGGSKAAHERLKRFLAEGLKRYAEDRGAPEESAVSELSPYLHFGQISPIEIALAVLDAKKVAAADRDGFLEELIVRRELALNHCLHEEAYDRYEAIPAWARASLAKHRGDPRPHLYDGDALAQGKTHDLYWNAAMKEMRETGYMHNRMRMYWGKKVLHWSKTPEEAFATLLWLNNRYFLDGRDPSSFTNVAWIFGLHDRPWAERPIFGLVRYMSENTLTKFDAAAYLRRVDELTAMEAGWHDRDA